MELARFVRHGRPTRVGSSRSRTRGSGGIGPIVAALLLALVPRAEAQQTGTVTGQVTDAASGQPVAAAQVYIVGTSLGTLTTANGRFMILNVPAGAHTLRAERIGSRTLEQEVTVVAGQSAVVNFELTTEALGLDEIVVTGTAGAARRREIGNSISQINMAEVEEPPVNMDAVLQARAPGLSVLQSSASAGSGAMIRLRGNVSVAMSNQPLIYVDGVRMRSDGFAKNVPPVGYAGRSNNDISSPLNDINPGDIERIEILKGAAATTLYGTEASAGVIQIFTKRGHTGQARWTAQIDQGFSRVLPFGPDPSERPPSEPAQTSAGGTSDYIFINPWLRNGYRQRYALSVAGGGEALSYYMSGTMEDNQGVLPNDLENKTVVRGNFTFSPLASLQLQWNTSYTQTDISNTAAGNNAHGLTLNAYRRDANYLGDESKEAIDPFLNQEITSNIDHLVTGLTATYSPLANLTNRFTIGWDLAQLDNRNLRPFGFIRAPDGILSDGRYEYSTLTFDYVGTYDLNLMSDLRSSFSWGGQSVTTETQSTEAYGEDFPGPGAPTVSNAGTTLGFERRVRVINAGLFFQNLFDFRNRYFLTVGLRVDGNSAFGKNFGFQAYPKASLSYVISDEDFWNENFGRLKLRAAWGEAGRAPGAFDAVKTYNAVGWGGDPAFFPLNVGNSELGPERTSEIEVGAEGSFLGDRLTAEFTWYKQTTDDALFYVRQTPSLGFLNSQLDNVGKLENRGIELAATATIVRRDAIEWDLGGTVSTNHSKVLDLGGAPPFSLGDFGWIVEGQPVPVIRADCVTNEDEKADPIIQQECTIGPNMPTRILGVHTTLRFPKGISLTARGEYQGGHYMYDGAAWNAVRRSVRWPGCFDAYRVQETQGDDQMTALQRARCVVANTQADYFVYPADFFKLREVTLHLPIPTAWVPGAGSASLNVSGRNAWKWVNDEFPVFEPEMGANEGFNTQVRSILEHVPPPATYTASLRVTF